MMKIGITGGIGAGKSFVCQLLEEKGYPVFYSDDEAKIIIQKNQEIIQKVTSLFGKDAYLSGRLNRDFIAQEIFTHPEKRLQLNAIIHPAVYNEFDHWAEKHKGIVFIESALMLDTGHYKKLDAVILVLADLDIRIQRIQERDDLPTERILQRIKAQSSDEEKKRLTDFTIQNNGDLTSTIEQLNQIIVQLENKKSE